MNVKGLDQAGLKWVFLLSSRLEKVSDEDEALLKSFNGELVYADLLCQADCALFDQAASRNRDTVDRELKKFIEDSSFAKTVFFIPAMFSREIYPVFPTHGTANIMLFHDLIPFLYHEQYFQDHEGLPRKDYAQRFREFYKTDLFVTNSQTTADDLTVYFGVDPSRIVAILGAAADRSAAKPALPAIAKKLQKGFVLMPSGDDFRKNNIRAVQAFAELHTSEKLVITSNFGPESQKALSELCPNVLFVGSVSDNEFLWYLDNAKAVFFPALYEGLGMPVLEAVERGAKIACSNTPVFAEIDQTAFYFFDPSSVSSMANVLKQVLADDVSLQDWKSKQQRYPAIAKAFSWANTAGRFLEAVDACQPSPTRPRLAIFAPSPSSYSSVGKYAFEVHAELSRLYDIDYFIENGHTSFKPTRPNILEYAANYYPAGSFNLNRAQEYDKVLYNIGNSEFHVDTILNSLRLSAAAIIHDTRLNGIFDYMQHHGFISIERREYEAMLDDAFSCQKSSCLSSIATNQQVLFCHSGYAHKAIGEVVKDKVPSIEQIIHPIGVPRIELVRDNEVAVSFAGIISEDKGIHLVSDISKLGNVRVKVFGFGVLGDSPLLQGLNNVAIMHDLTDKEFQDETRSSDLLVNYRPNYHGETSRSTLEAMRYGTVVIVKNVGWYGELPDDTVVKVNNEVEVLDAVRKLVERPEERQAIARNAREFLREHYSYKRYAELIQKGLGK